MFDNACLQRWQCWLTMITDKNVKWPESQQAVPDRAAFTTPNFRHLMWVIGVDCIEYYEEPTHKVIEKYVTLLKDHPWLHNDVETLYVLYKAAVLRRLDDIK